MDRSIATLPDPESIPPGGDRLRGTRPRDDRRSRVRQKLHTPVYASFNGPQTSMVVDLSELLDLSEDGFGVQTAPESKNPLEVNRPVTICLDLPETRSFVHGSGQVIWCDEEGRAGIRFSFLADRADRVLKEWLFVNLLIACANHAARTAQRELHFEQHLSPEQLREAQPVAGDPIVTGPALAEVTGAEPLGMAMPAEFVSAEPMAAESGAASLAQADERARTDAELIDGRAQLVSALDDVRRQVREIEARQLDGDLLVSEYTANNDAIFTLITEWALWLTGASGAALALVTGGRMFCRASVGNPAPPLGSKVDIHEGLSGECVRTGLAVVCDDTAANPRVDADLCRALGLGSFLAVPIVSDFRVVGLLEVFSPRPRNFAYAATGILERLIELVPTNEAIPEPAFIYREPDGTACDRELIEDERAKPQQTARSDELKNANESTAPQTGALNTGEPHIVQSPPPKPAPSPEKRTSSVAAPKVSTSGPLPRESQQPHRVSEVPSESPEHHPDRKESRAVALPEGVRLMASAGAHPPIAHLGLLLCVLAVVALVLGYLLAPVIERHLAAPHPTGSAQTQQGSSVAPVLLQNGATRKSQATPEEIRKMAEQGDAEAQWLLGTFYRNGDGVPQNDFKAVEWFQLSAEQGYVRALSTLGSSYWQGRGVRQDYARAYFWFELALAEGDENSKPLLEGLATQMTQAQVANARQQAEAWLQAHNQPTKTAAN
jgi:GAF domain/Sel1 repeat